MYNKIIFIFNFIIVAFLSLNCYAQIDKKSTTQQENSELQGNFHDWLIFKTDRGDQEICYLLSIPISSQKTIHFRDNAYFIITHDAKQNNEISTSPGFYLKENSNTEISFGSQKFYLFSYKNLAWANNSNEDIDIIKAMKENDQMFITSISNNKELVIDRYSLIGFNQAYNKMRRICNDIKDTTKSYL